MNPAAAATAAAAAVAVQCVCVRERARERASEGGRSHGAAAVTHTHCQYLTPAPPPPHHNSNPIHCVIQQHHVESHVQAGSAGFVVLREAAAAGGGITERCPSPSLPLRPCVVWRQDSQLPHSRGSLIPFKLFFKQAPLHG